MLVMEDEVEPCYCGHTGIDHEGCKCFTPTNMEEKPLWNMIDKEIIEKYYPTKATPPGYEPLSEEQIEDNEWEWGGGEFDELIPWTFGSQEVDEEKFLVLLDAWNNHSNVIAFTSAGHLPEKKEARERLKKEGSIDASYDYIVFRNEKLWRVSITPNMGLDWIELIQELPDLYQLKDIKLKVEIYGE